jgi:hypothetical protein
MDRPGRAGSRPGRLPDAGTDPGERVKHRGPVNQPAPPIR